MLQPQSITQSFADELSAPLINPRWSWGGWHEATNRVFLRVWSHDHSDAPDRGKVVRLLGQNWTRTSLGYHERLRHIANMKNGAEAYGVVASAARRGTRPIRIQSYNASELIKLGAFIHSDRDPASVFVRVGNAIPIAKISVQTRSVTTAAADVAELIARQDLHHRPTYRRALIDACLGQGKFRRELLAKLNNACAVTGSAVQEALRASHMKPRSRSTDRQRLDSNNGMPLVETLDALFARGLISFKDDGSMLISGRISKDERCRLNLHGRLQKMPIAA